MKPYEAYFNDEVIKILCQNSIHILFIEPITDDRSLEPSFRLYCQNHIYFAKFSSFRRFSDSFLSKLSQLNHMNERILLLPILSKDIYSLKRQLNIYEWLYGDNLKSVLSDAPYNTIKEYAYRCGALLRKIHMETKCPSYNCTHFVTSFDEYLKRLEIENFKFVKPFNYRKFFYMNYHFLLKTRDMCFVHMDFKPKNIMLCDGKLTVVDLDSSRLGDPWWDFFDKAFSFYPEKELFNKTLVRAYFKDIIPDEFWEYFKVLSVYALVQKTACLLRRKETSSIRLLETYLWNSYDGFSELIPKWMY